MRRGKRVVPDYGGHCFVKHRLFDRLSIGSGLFDGDAWFQSPKDNNLRIELVLPYARPVPDSRKCSIDLHRQNDLGILSDQNAIEAIRQHADYGYGNLIDHERSADYSRVTPKLPLPEPVGNVRRPGSPAPVGVIRLIQ